MYLGWLLRFGRMRRSVSRKDLSSGSENRRKKREDRQFCHLSAHRRRIFFGATGKALLVRKRPVEKDGLFLTFLQPFGNLLGLKG